MSKSVIVTVFVVMVTFVGTLFGLVYHTQNKVLDKLDAEDLKSARKWAMVQMRTQNSSWLIRQMNGALRPFAGWMGLAYLTEKCGVNCLRNTQVLNGWQVPGPR